LQGNLDDLQKRYDKLLDKIGGLSEEKDELSRRNNELESQVVTIKRLFLADSWKLGFHAIRKLSNGSFERRAFIY
jgi:predicted nuclease with TOPRIM domain